MPVKDLQLSIGYRLFAIGAAGSLPSNSHPKIVNDWQVSRAGRVDRL
jgi:hypothetical protein